MAVADLELTNGLVHKLVTGHNVSHVGPLLQQGMMGAAFTTALEGLLNKGVDYRLPVPLLLALHAVEPGCFCRTVHCWSRPALLLGAAIRRNNHRIVLLGGHASLANFLGLNFLVTGVGVILIYL